MTGFTPYHSQYLAHRLTLEGVSDDAFAQTLSTSRVDLNPHQVDAALFALASPISHGAILADEVGLGKTIEACLVMAQKWVERRRRIILMVPASLRKQWSQELRDKFSLPSVILESKTWREQAKAGAANPFNAADQIVITSYEFAASKGQELAAIAWDLVIFDEAHRLRNVHAKGSATRAKTLRDALRGRFKLLLTATPLQNSLMELFGLASMIDDKLFGDEKSFRALYGGARPAPNDILTLRERLTPVCHRTLRRTVQEAGLINFTQRRASTYTFDPSDDEMRLYEGVSAYLKRGDTVAFGGKPNQLITLVVRKILGSSTFAVAQTLTKFIERLERMERPALDDIAEDDVTAIAAEEWEAEPNRIELHAETLNDIAEINEAKRLAEIAELTELRDIASRITSNAKGDQLAAHLPEILAQVVERGGARKAVIFTESVRTQTYLADLLAARGFEGQIARLNGTNRDPESQAIYADWLSRHRGTEAVSGSPSADMKAALVEAFRERYAILIATESGAEGINLQFCSVLINFDLPWNPQRVEQRIGRCHRYGQKIDVTVVNFLNTKNHAERRILELLAQKFRLFDGVFGASDEVLGAIENGVDFEKSIFQIVQSTRTAEEVEQDFAALEQRLEPSIDASVQDARKRLLDRVDEDVVRQLKTRKGALDTVLSAYDQQLLTLARAELPDARFHPDAPRRFDWRGQTWTTEWPLADQRGWGFFRMGEGQLAREIADRAKARALPAGHIRFHLDQYANGQISALNALRGRAGWLRVVHLTIASAGARDASLLLAAVTDAGTVIEPEDIARLFLVPGHEQVLLAAPPEAALAARIEALTGACVKGAELKSGVWLQQETDKLEAYAEDMARAIEAEIKALETEARTMRAAVRLPRPLAEKVATQRGIKALDARRDDLVLSRHQQRQAVRKQIDALLDEAQASLATTPEATPLFTLRWEIAA
jgi:superfamily II DNA or RNA helicase